MRKRLRSAKDVEGELKFLENSLERLLQSFSIERESALEQGRESLQKLREKEKCYYRPRAGRMEGELRQLRYASGRMEGVPFSIFPRMNELEKSLRKARAHFTGTVNRLLRCTGPQPGENECTE